MTTTLSTHITNLLDTAALADAISDGLVNRQQHPEDPNLLILNYSKKCQAERAWTPTTRACRGLIYRGDTGQVIARSFPKFFNYGEPGSPAIDLDAPVIVTDKLDGSLGIVYTAPDGLPAVATRGSFASEQALHATALLRERWPAWRPRPDRTTLVEIIYPDNRIVVDYGDADTLVLLAHVDIDTGYTWYFPGESPYWPGERAEVMQTATLRDALALPPRGNAEGVVVHDVGSDLRVKIKQDDYVQLHRIVTGMNERVVWERLGAGATLAEICEPLPDEFHDWVRGVARGLYTQLGEILVDTYAADIMIRTQLGPDFTRRDYAELACRSPHRAYLFGLLDGKDLTRMAWPKLRPSGATRMTGGDE